MTKKEQPKKIQLSVAKLNQRRKRAMLLIGRGASQGEAARRVGVTKQAMSIWLQKFKSGGSQALRARPPGRRRILNDAQRSELKTILDRGPLVSGYEDDLWSLPRINAVIARQFGIQISSNAVLYMLQKENWRIRRRRSHR